MARKEKKAGRARTWYSNGRTEKEVSRMDRKYARINEVGFGLDAERLALFLDLEYEDGQREPYTLVGTRDIRELLIRTGKTDIFELENVIVETYNCNKQPLAISINPHLVAQSSNSDSD